MTLTGVRTPANVLYMNTNTADQALTTYANAIADMLEAAIERFGSPEAAREALTALMAA